MEIEEQVVVVVGVVGGLGIGTRDAEGEKGVCSVLVHNDNESNKKQVLIAGLLVTSASLLVVGFQLSVPVLGCLRFELYLTTSAFH